MLLYSVCQKSLTIQKGFFCVSDFMMTLLISISPSDLITGEDGKYNKELNWFLIRATYPSVVETVSIEISLNHSYYICRHIG